MSVRTPLATALVFAVCLVSPGAQQAPAAARSGSADESVQQPTPKASQPAPPASTPRIEPPPPPPAAPPPTGPFRATNVRVDVTITDQSSGGKPVIKTVTLVQANGDRSSIRSSNDVAVPQRVVRDGSDPSGEAATPIRDYAYNFMALPLNIDARSHVMDDSRVRLELQVSYETAVPDRVVRPGQPVTAKVTENLSMVLDSGKPVVISQSADAASDRRVTVEVKATILK